jgi:hypothetical protein
MTYRFVDSFRATAGLGWNCSSFQNKFEKLVHLVGFILKKKTLIILSFRDFSWFLQEDKLNDDQFFHKRSY